MKVQVYTRKDGRFDWRLVHSNGETLCGSDQGYENRQDAVGIATKVVTGAYFPGGADITFSTEETS